MKTKKYKNTIVSFYNFKQQLHAISLTQVIFNIAPVIFKQYKLSKIVIDNIQNKSYQECYNEKLTSLPRKYQIQKLNSDANLSKLVPPQYKLKF